MGFHKMVQLLYARRWEKQNITFFVCLFDEKWYKVIDIVLIKVNRLKNYQFLNKVVS